MSKIADPIAAQDESRRARVEGVGPRVEGHVSPGFEPVRARWMESALGAGERMELRLERRVLAGRFIEIDAEGALLLAPSDGSPPQKIRAGEVFFPAS